MMSLLFYTQKYILILVPMKINKYDRQIRLWGHNGQKLLAQSKVALLGCSGVGIEAIKNLILPGVGQVQLWDDQKVSVQDLSSSFFYQHQSVGQSRSEVACRNLLEMNPDVCGQFYTKHPQDLLLDSEKLKTYSLLISNNLGDQLNEKISKICWQNNVAVIFILIVGFTVYIRIQKKQHFVTSENLSNKKYYLCLHDPFESLINHSNRWNIPQMLNKLKTQQSEQQKKALLKEISYIPYPIILMQAYALLDQNQRKRQNIVDLINGWGQVVGEDHRQNFVQALGRILDLYQTVDNFLLTVDIFETQQVKNANANSQQFLIFLKVCKFYLQKNKRLPVQTKLPDMHTSTLYYLELKNIYKQQHLKCVKQMMEMSINLIGKSKLTENITSNYIQNLESLQIIQTKPYYEEIQRINNDYLEWDDIQMRNIMVALRVYHQYLRIHIQPPTLKNLEQMCQLAEKMKGQLKLSEVDQRYIRQICRSEGQTTISMNSIGGAVAAQQAIKLLTSCFTPCNNGYLYSGIFSKGYSLKL